MEYSIESQVDGFKALPPYKRTLKVLMCPQIHHIKNLSLGLTILEPGWTSSPHSHGTEEEIWYVLSGTGQAKVGDETIKIAEGTAIYCPPGQSHQLINNGKEDLRVLWAFSPPGFETKYLGRKGGDA
jgi:mannose-6-phosphate isomerase-like protein (cupin superfamily)